MTMPLPADHLEDGQAMAGGAAGSRAPIHLAAAADPPLAPELCRVFRVYGRAYGLFVGVATGVALALAFLLPPRYCATASLMPIGSGMPQGTFGRLAKIAGIAPARDELPAETLTSILRSRRISDPILDASFERWPNDPHPIPFKNVISRTAPGHEPAREKLYKKLAGATRFGMDPETRIVSLAVETRYPYLSVQVANAYLEHLNLYTTVEHQSKAEIVTSFIGKRMEEVRSEVEAAERELHAFYNANQNYATSSDPDIRMAELRLRRNLELRVRVMTELVTSQEAARVEAMNEAPVIQVIDRGGPPELRSWPPRRLLVGGALLGSAALGLALMLVADHFGIRSLRDVRATA